MDTQPEPLDDLIRAESEEETAVHLGAAELSSILKWSKDISSDINLSSGQLISSQ